MKTYKYNEQTLQYEEIHNRKISKLISSLILICLISLGGFGYSFMSKEPQKQEIIITQQTQPFSEQLLRQEIQKLNLPFEEVIVAQSKLETGNYTSEIFKCSHNLFGQKQAKVRVNCQSGVNNNHATYDNWILSLYDYTFWYSTYASKIKNENEYLEFLSQVYAEDTTYITQLKQIIKQNKDGK